MTSLRSTATGPRDGAPLLALDTASPVVSVAVVAGDREARILAQRSVLQRQSSAILLRLVDEVLREADLRIEGLGGLVALAGPGSFTGLRIGLATALGLHQATGLPATTLGSLEVLAAAWGEHAHGPELDPEPVIAVVDARRGDYFTQTFTQSFPQGFADASTATADLRPLAPPCRLPTAEIAALGPAVVVGHDLSALRQLPGWPEGTAWHEPGPLAATAARLARRRTGTWDPVQLTRPLYLEAPAVGPPAS